MRESLVGLCHTVDILLALESGALFLVGSLDFSSQFQSHSLFAAFAREADKVLHSDRLFALGADFGRHLESGTTDTAALHLDRRSDVGQSLLPHLKAVLFRTVGHNVDSLIENLVGDSLLAAHHQVVDELRYQHVIVFRIRKDDSLFWFCFSHFS